MDIRQQLIKIWGDYKVNIQFRETTFSPKYMRLIERSVFSVNICQNATKEKYQDCKDALLDALNIAYWPLYKWNHETLTKLHLHNYAKLLRALEKRAEADELQPLQQVAKNMQQDLLGTLDNLQEKQMIKPQQRLGVVQALMA